MRRIKRWLRTAVVAVLVAAMLVTPTFTVSAIDSTVSLKSGGSSVDPNNDPGTLTYNVSDDGNEVTISYVVGNQQRTYTVPNQNNFTSGGLVAVDDLGRSLYTSEDVGVYGSTGEHYVGLFYFLWQGADNTSNYPGYNYPVYDMQKVYEEHPDIAGNLDKTIGIYYGNDNSKLNWFAEPLYGYYWGNDQWVHRKHIELLTNAGVDFLYLDVTNNVSYWPQALNIMSICHELNEQGYKAPKIVFYTHTNSSGVVREVYNNIYSQNLYPDTWFMIQGKPCIVAYPGDNIDNFFYTKTPQWPNEPEVAGGNGWPWIDFEWPQRVYKGYESINGQTVERNAINVSVAQHCGNIVFSTSALYGYMKNRGRSFSAGTDAKRPTYYGAGNFAYQQALEESYNRARQNDQETHKGTNFQKQFDYAYERMNEDNVTYILVTGWNEWVAQRQDEVNVDLSDVPITPSVLFVDTYNVEYSRDAEMTRGAYFDNYYMQLAANIQKLRGTAPVIVQDRRQSVDVAGSFGQWTSVPITYHDPQGDTVDRYAYGQQHLYTNTTGRNDIVEAKVTADTRNVYFYVKTASSISSYTSGGSWMQLLLNTDNETTGWYGYDYIVNYQASSNQKTTVARFNGTDNHQFSFIPTGEVSYQYKGNEMMIAVPLSMLNIQGNQYRELYFQFKWVDSDTTIRTMEDCYENGDCAPLGRMNYVFQNYIPGIPVYSGRPRVEEPVVEYVPFDEEKGVKSCHLEASINVKTIKAGGVATICVGRDIAADVDCFVVVNERTNEALIPVKIKDIVVSDREPNTQRTYIYIRTTKDDIGDAVFTVYAKYRDGTLSADSAQCTLKVQ